MAEWAPQILYIELRNAKDRQHFNQPITEK